MPWTMYSGVRALRFDGRVVGVGEKADLSSAFHRFSPRLGRRDRLDSSMRIAYHGVCEALLTADLRAARSEEEMVLLLKGWCELQLERGSLTEYRVEMGQNNWPEKKCRSELCSIPFPDVPVVLRRVDGHAVLISTMALELGQVCCPEKLEGGEIVMEGDRPTGLLVDNAVERVSGLDTRSGAEEKGIETGRANCLLMV